MNEISLQLEEIYNLTYQTLTTHGCDDENASALAETITHAERDRSVSHGLFRLPSYVASLKSKKVNGKARPKAKKIAPGVIKVFGQHAFAPMALKVGLPKLIDLAKENGIAILAITESYHMAALWHETEAIANNGLVGIACTSYKPSVAPTGAKKALFGTNPISFACPRQEGPPVVFDMATAAMAMGEVQIAAREGHTLPPGTGLDPQGEPTTDPSAIANGGVLLPFGGYKGSAISMMVELLAGALIGETFSYETANQDNNDGGPPKGGEFLLALNPEKIAGPDWKFHAEKFFKELKSLEGTRLPGERRHLNRLDESPRKVNAILLDKIKSLV